MQRKDENEVFDFNDAQAHPVLGEAKDNQSRAQRKDENEVFDLNSAEAHPVLKRYEKPNKLGTGGNCKKLFLRKNPRENDDNQV